jgi:hypothetical protein
LFYNKFANIFTLTYQLVIAIIKKPNSRVIAGIIVISSILLIFPTIGFVSDYFTTPNVSPDSELGEYIPIPDPEANLTRLDELLGYLNGGGVPKDGIPSINIPHYVSREEAESFLDDADIVFGVNYQGELLAFPQHILVWHEIVNLKINGTKVSITYCPLTGSAIGYIAKLNLHPTTFGVSGELSNSNLVMYDRLSDSYWPQILGQAISGPSKGVTLSKIQVFWTSWLNWKSVFPETKVLSENTGKLRNYEYDPYGEYRDPESYYNDGAPLFPVENYDPSLDDKTVVIGIELGQDHLAIEKNHLRQEKVLNSEINNEPIVVFYDEVLDVARVFKSTINDIEYHFTESNGKFVDQETNSEWTFEGISNLGQLEQVVYFDVMWYAWIAFFQDSKLIM